MVKSKAIMNMSKYWIFFVCFIAFSWAKDHVCLGAYNEIAFKDEAKLAKLIYYSGNDVNDFGDMYECQKMKGTRFFVFIVKLKFISAGLGICAPDQCFVKDFQEMSNELTAFLLQKYPASQKILMNDSIEVVDVEEHNSRSLTWQAMTTLIIFLSLSSLTLIGTIIECSHHYSGSTPKNLSKILLCFSLKSNFSKLLTYPKDFDNLHVLNGIRVFSMLFICYSHNYVYSFSGPTVNPTRAIDITKDFWSHLATFPLYMVDMFFIISGFLVSYLVIKDLQNKRGKYNWFMFVVHRLIRICPIYFLVLLFFINLMKFMGRGALWPMFTSKYEEPCDYWWTNVLFISNIYPPDKHACMGWSWFISNDMQFHLLSPFILAVHYKSKTKGFALLLILILTNFFITLIQSFINDYNPGVIHGISKDEQFVKSYQRPFNRVGPYLIGMLFGLVYRTYVDQIMRKNSGEIELNEINSTSEGLLQERCKVTQLEITLTEWVHVKQYRNVVITVTSVIMLCYPFFTYKFDNNGPDYWAKSVKAFYLASEHIGFALIFIAWLIPFTEGYGGWMFRFLSHKFFSIPAKISFSFYLIHPIIILLFVFNRPDSYFISHFNYIYTWPSTVLYSVFWATLATLIVESPVLALEKLLLRPTH
jgi:peptidoglycan/LPS O-acetylase OafA/YrhL